MTELVIIYCFNFETGTHSSVESAVSIFNAEYKIKGKKNTKDASRKMVLVDVNPVPREYHAGMRH